MRLHHVQVACPPAGRGRRPARKAHAALVIGDVAELEAVGERLAGLGFEVDRSQRSSVLAVPQITCG